MLRNKLHFYLIISFVFSFGCQDSAIVSSGIISKDTLVDILADMHVIEASFALGHLDSSSNGIKPENVNKAVLEKYSISRSRFDTSYNYYISKPKEFNQIYDEVINKLSQKQARVNK